MRSLREAKLRHAQWYAQVAKQANGRYLEGGMQILAGLDMFDRERIQIDTGWIWLRQQLPLPATDMLLLKLANETLLIGDMRYDTRYERIPYLETMLDAAKRLNQDVSVVRALCHLGSAYTSLGSPKHAIELCEQALNLARQIGDLRGEGEALGNLGRDYHVLGQSHYAIELSQEALKIGREIGNRRIEGQALLNICNAYYGLGHLRQVITNSDHALDVFRVIGENRLEGITLRLSRISRSQPYI